jgi:hypothetical protein
MEMPMTPETRAETPVLELVSFRLIVGTDPASFVALADATDAPLRRQPGFVSRRLVHAPDGTWTDIVEWTSLAAATTAAQIVLADPGFAPFLAAIDLSTASMAHPALVWRMD